MIRPTNAMLLTAALAVFLTPAGALGQAPAAPAPCVPPPSPPAPDWTGSLGAGLSVTTGNSDTLGFNLAFGIKYAPKGPGTFKAEGLYILQRSDGVRTVDKIGALGRYEYALSSRAFAFGEVAYQRDVFKNVDYLVSPLVGAGYRFLDGPKVTLSGDASVGGAFEKSPEFGATSSGAYAL